MLHSIYRISDGGNPKLKMQNATKFGCLDNFINKFGIQNLTIISDNCKDETIKEISKRTENIITTSLGNSKSFLFALDYAIENFSPNDYVYFCEDDYLHKAGSKKVLLEGLKISEYATLYDHPDKYFFNGPNPFIEDGGEISRVLLTKSTHWKTTNSTTMTFGTKISVIAEDRDLFAKFCTQNIPEDFAIFRILTGNFLNQNDIDIFEQMNVEKRRLISPLPGYSTHCEKEYLSPLENWEKY